MDSGLWYNSIKEKERKNLIKRAITIIVTKLMKGGNYYVNEL